MKRMPLFISAGLLAFLVSVPAASAFGWKDVVKMRKAGIADSLIIQKIEYSGKTFHLDADDMETLKEAGVSDGVISAMLRTEAEDEADYYDYDYGYSYYGHPYDYPHSRLYLGFGLGYYYPYPSYYDGYWYPRYRAYGSPRYYWIHRYGGHDGYRAYTPYRGWTGNYGDTRYRSRVGDRTYTGNRGYTGHRVRPGSTQPGTGGSGGRTRPR